MGSQDFRSALRQLRVPDQAFSDLDLTFLAPAFNICQPRHRPWELFHGDLEDQQVSSS